MPLVVVVVRWMQVVDGNDSYGGNIISDGRGDTGNIGGAYSERITVESIM